MQSIEEHVAAFYHSTKLQHFLVSANSADPSQRALVTLAQQLEAWLAQRRGGKENARILSTSINLPLAHADSPDKPALKQVRVAGHPFVRAATIPHQQRNANLEQQLRISNATIKTLLQDDEDEEPSFADGADIFMTPQPSHTPSPLARGPRAPLAAADDAARLRLRDVLIDQLRAQNKDLTGRVEALASSNAALREQVTLLTQARDSNAALQSSIKQLRAENKTLKAARAAEPPQPLTVRCGNFIIGHT